jgi:hypothetical protein
MFMMKYCLEFLLEMKIRFGNLKEGYYICPTVVGK